MAAANSACTAANTAAGFKARDIGRPMTTCVAPAAIACAGVAALAWSLCASPESCVPGVTISAPGGKTSRNCLASNGDDTTPWQPAAIARRASRATCSRTVEATPTFSKSWSLMLVTTVSARILTCRLSAERQNATQERSVAAPTTGHPCRNPARGLPVRGSPSFPARVKPTVFTFGGRNDPAVD